MKLGDIDPAVVARARKIRLLVLDVDGVLTDGKLLFTNSGDEIKAFDSRDGHGIKLLQQSGVAVGIITGRSSDIVSRRAGELGIEYLFQGRGDKLTALTELLRIYAADHGALDYEEIACMGDDYPDLPVIRAVGLGMMPADGHWVLKQYAHWISSCRGGEGAVRQACDLLLLANGGFDDRLRPYL